MATMVLSVAGAAIGGALGGPWGAFAGRAIGALAGSVIDAALFGQKQRIDGPRLADTKVSTSTYGVPIALLFGSVRIGSNVIWASDLRERAETRKAGGKGGRKSTATIYSYSCDLAVAFGLGPATAIPRIWGDGKLLAEHGVCRRASSLALYLGTETQMPDPTIEAAVGLGSTPAYRGVVYAVFRDLQLADFGNRIPLITAEIAGPPRSAGGVIGALAARAGVAERVCTANLGDPVPGYSVARAVSARAAIEEIAFAFGAEGTQVPGGVVLRRRGQGALGGLDAELIGCAETDPPEEDRLVIARAEETALPREVTFTFADPARDYQENTVRSVRQAGRGEGRTAVELPLVISGDAAKARAEQIHRDLWAARSTVERLTLPPLCNAVQAGDRFDVHLPSGWQRLALSRVAVGANGLVEAAAVLEQPETWLPHAAVADSGLVPPNLAPALVPSIAHLLDLPMLISQDDDAGFYVALGGAPGWRLASLYRSADGVDYDVLLTQDLAAVVGTVANALGSGPTAILDHGNTLTVTLANPEHELDTVTFEALLRGANAAVVGSEILQFQSATLVGPGQYVLSRLLRGRLGTDDAVAGHVAGERFVLLDGLEAIVRVRDGLARVGVPSTYKAVSLYQPFGDAAPFGFTNTARALRPYAVLNLAGVRDGGGTLTITWTRRTRIPAPWADHVDAPLGETSERYEADIRNAADTTTLRTLSVAAPSAVYVAAEQVADFGSVQGAIRVRVFQISESVGRGIMRSAIL